MRGATAAELEALYRERFDRFVRVATAICRDPDLGRDAVQSGFAAAVKHRKTFRRDAPLEAWVWQIVVNEARAAARARPELAADEPVAPSANGHDEDADPLGVRRFIATLPSRQREAVFLRYFADLDYRTIARVLDLEPGTVSATLSAARQTLRKRLEASRR